MKQSNISSRNSNNSTCIESFQESFRKLRKTLCKRCYYLCKCYNEGVKSYHMEVIKMRAVVVNQASTGVEVVEHEKPVVVGHGQALV